MEEHFLWCQKLEKRFHFKHNILIKYKLMAPFLVAVSPVVGKSCHNIHWIMFHDDNKAGNALFSIFRSHSVTKSPVLSPFPVFPSSDSDLNRFENCIVFWNYTKTRSYSIRPLQVVNNTEDENKKPESQNSFLCQKQFPFIGCKIYL